MSASGWRSDESGAGSSPRAGNGLVPGHADRVEQAVVHAEAAGVGDAPDHRRADLPARAQREHLVEVPGSTIASIRSWLSDVITSTGFMPGSRLATRATSTSMPAPVFAAVSDAAHDRPAAPRSCTPIARPASSSARHASMSRFSSNGSPTCTDGPLGLGPFLEARRREHARATDAVTPGRRAEQHRQVALALGARQHEPLARAARRGTAR